MFRRKFGRLLGVCTLVGTLGLSAHDLKKAEDAYNHTDFQKSLAFLDKDSNDSAVNFMIGRDHYMLGDFKKATDYLQKAADAAPNSSVYADWLGRAWGRRAETSNPLFAPAYAGKARQAFERSVELDSKNREALSDLFDYYLDAPGFLGGGFDKAAGVADKIKTADPAEGYFAQAQLANKRNQFQAAEQQLREAVNLAPRQVGRLIDLAKFLANQGRNRESDEIFIQAEKLAPNAPRVWFARAAVLVKQKRNMDEAKQLLTKYLQSPLTPDDPPKQEATRLLRQVASGA